MIGEVPIIKKPPVLLRKDSQYAFKQISSIIKDKDYEDLGNHAMKVMGETGLFSLTQVMYQSISFYPSIVSVLYTNMCFLFL